MRKPRTHLVWNGERETRCGQQLDAPIPWDPPEQQGQQGRLRWSTCLDDVTCPRCEHRAFGGTGR